ncbi:MAG: Transcriptional regulatory protein ros [Nitrospira sp. OLB3]|nr:MAG: Transcriptional regulatory protein ros [Nitrospira sp. OLB3]
MADIEQPDVNALAVQLLSAYLANNTVAHTDVAELVRSTKAALVEDAAAAKTKPEDPTYTPAVSVRRSLASSDHILSLIDGKPYKTLKRHLASHGLTPESYRKRYNLPAGYPLVAPSFAAQRRAIAERIRLGRRPVDAAPAAAPSSTPITSAPKAAKPKGVAKGTKPITAAAPADASIEIQAPKAAKSPTKSASKAANATKHAAPKPKAATAAAAESSKISSVAGDAKTKPRRGGTLKLFKEAAAKSPSRQAKPETPAKSPEKKTAKAQTASEA